MMHCGPGRNSAVTAVGGQRRRWSVRAVVVGEKHLDALSIGTVTDSDPTVAGERICARLPHGDSPFGDFYLVATPVHIDDRSHHVETDRSLEHAFIAQVHRPNARRSWTPGRWTPASGDQRFSRDWPWQRTCSRG